MKLTKNIWFRELVPKSYYEELGTISDRDVRFVQIDLIDDLQKIRNHFNSPLVINDWERFNWRGFRNDTWEYYNPESMHAWWMAYDFHIIGYDVEEVRQHIIDNRDELYPRIMGIELDVNWIHVDKRYRPKGDLLKFAKSKKD